MFSFGGAGLRRDIGRVDALTGFGLGGSERVTMTRWPYGGWASVGIDAWALGMEASAVIGLRVMRIAAGGAAAAGEAQLMVSEKMQAAFELQTAMVTGQLGVTPLSGARKVLRHYRRKVKANRKRLG